MPSPVNGSTKPAASPTSSQPGPAARDDAVPDRRGAADRGEARAAGEPPRDCRERRRWRSRSDRAAVPAAVRQRKRHPDVQLAAGRRRQTDVIVRPTCISPWSVRLGDARVVRDQPEPAGEAHGSVGTDRRLTLERVPSAPTVQSRAPRSRPGCDVAQPGPAHAAALDDERRRGGCAPGARRRARRRDPPASRRSAPIEAPRGPRAAGVGVPDRRRAAAGMQVHAAQRNGSSVQPASNAQPGELLDDPRARVLGAGLRPRMLRGLDQQDRRAGPCQAQQPAQSRPGPRRRSARRRWSRSGRRAPPSRRAAASPAERHRTREAGLGRGARRARRACRHAAPRRARRSGHPAAAERERRWRRSRAAAGARAEGR